MASDKNHHLDSSTWRYGVISGLLHQGEPGLSMRERLKKAAERIWVHPVFGNIEYSPDTLRHWVFRYKKHGPNGLETKIRSDKSKSKATSVFEKALTDLRTQMPQASLEKLLSTLIKNEKWNGVRPSRSAIYRLAKLKGLNRKSSIVHEIKEAHAFAFVAFGEMWVADFLHGPKVRDGRVTRKTYLLAILDDATRYVVFAGFFFTEGVSALIDGLSMAIRRFGVPERFYTDNGSAFRSRHLSHVALRLGMHLPHTPAYRPQGRGKVERFFRTVREQCLKGYVATSLAGLTEHFNAWLNTYHHSFHVGIETTPLAKRLSSPKQLKSLPDVAQLDIFFGMQEKRKVARNGTISLGGVVFDIKGALPGETIEFTYLPWDLSVIHVGKDRYPAKPIDLYKNAKRFENNPKTPGINDKEKQS